MSDTKYSIIPEIAVEIDDKGLAKILYTGLQAPWAEPYANVPCDEDACLKAICEDDAILLKDNATNMAYAVDRRRMLLALKAWLEAHGGSPFPTGTIEPGTIAAHEASDILAIAISRVKWPPNGIFIRTIS